MIDYIHKFFFPEYLINKYEKYGDPKIVTKRLTGKSTRPVIIKNHILQN